MGALRGSDLRQAFAGATLCLERYRDSINALNVFPVPDGDTGTNMLLTMRSALEKCPDSPGLTAGEAASGLADGAFWGARGNSGVILSQLFRGLADALLDEDLCDGPGLARWLDLAANAAYQSVAQPVEGTMLTVLRTASAATRDSLQIQGEADPLSLWESAFRSATDALYLTPTQLPVLKEAGVVDAGGMGVVVIMGGGLCALTGQDQDLIDQAVAACCIEPGAAAQSMDDDYLDSTLESQWGYCIQFLISGAGTGAEEVRQGLGEKLAESAVVVGDSRNLRVHVHAADPGPPLSYGASLGDLYQIDIENMGGQNTRFVAEHRARAAEVDKVALVAVTQGGGLADLFRDGGCAAVIDGGQTMNPSIGQILQAVEAIGAENVIVLPNNSNVVATAEQSAGANPSLHVVPSSTVPQGVAAMLAFNPEGSIEDNLTAMTGALSTVATIEVTRAVRSSTINGLSIEAGTYIGLLEGELVASGDNPEDALRSAIDGVFNSADQIVTLFQGSEASPEAADELRRRLEGHISGAQVDLVFGGQPHYHYLASVE